MVDTTTTTQVVLWITVFRVVCGTSAPEEETDVVIVSEADISVEVRPDSDDCFLVDVEDDMKDVLERLVAAARLVDSEVGMPEPGVNVP